MRTPISLEEMDELDKHLHSHKCPRCRVRIWSCREVGCKGKIVLCLICRTPQRQREWEREQDRIAEEKRKRERKAGVQLNMFKRDL